MKLVLQMYWSLFKSDQNLFIHLHLCNLFMHRIWPQTIPQFNRNSIAGIYFH